MENYYFKMDHLSVGYNKKALIHDICIGIKKGEIVTLIGPNGYTQGQGRAILERLA